MDWIDAETATEPRTPTTTNWTINRCQDIRRSLSQRVHNARRRSPLSAQERGDMAQLYRDVAACELSISDRHDIDAKVEIPVWVLNTLYGHELG